MKTIIKSVFIFGFFLGISACSDENSRELSDLDIDEINRSVKRFQIDNKETTCPTIDKLISFNYLPLEQSGRFTNYLVIDKNGQCIAVLKDAN